MESSLVDVSIKHYGSTYHVPNCQAGKTNPKQSFNVYFSTLLEKFRQTLNADSVRDGKSLLDSELGEINDVIGRKCLGFESLCFAGALHSFWQWSYIYKYTAITKK